jgi:hypothetical protein
LKDLLSTAMPPGCDPRRIVMDVMLRDRFRMHAFAMASVLFWVLGIAGMLSVLIALKMPAIFWRLSLNSQDYQLLGYRNFPGPMIPVLGGAIAAMLLAMLFTALLISSSRQATLNRINISLKLISEQLKQMRDSTQPGQIQPQGEWDTISETPMKNLISFLVVFAAITISLAAATVIGGSSYHAGADDATKLWREGPKVAPFQAVRWRGQIPEVRVKETWYELMSLNDLSADQLVSFAQSVDKRDWRMRIQEDLPALLILMGHPAGPTVKLTLKDLSSGGVQTLEQVPMTEDNRRAMFDARISLQDKAEHLWRDGPMVSAFQDIRWNDQTPQVKVNGTWYELVAFNDLSPDQIISFAQTVDTTDWKKRFNEDLPSLLILMGHEPGPTVTLKLKDLVSGEVKTIQNVPMTAENRKAIMNSNNAPVNQPGTTGL